MTIPRRRQATFCDFEIEPGLWAWVPASTVRPTPKAAEQVRAGYAAVLSLLRNDPNATLPKNPNPYHDMTGEARRLVNANALLASLAPYLAWEMGAALAREYAGGFYGIEERDGRRLLRRTSKARPKKVTKTVSRRAAAT